jgi:restriction system protein
MADPQVWVVHMGRPGGKPREGSIDFTRELLDRGYIALGWPNMGDMSELSADLPEFKAFFRHHHTPGASERSVANQAEMLYQFVHEMRLGDIVA